MAQLNRLQSWNRIAVLVALCSLSSLSAMAGDPWQAVPSVADEASSERVIGRVVGIQGRVYAQTPGEQPRLLRENSPIFPGDRLITQSGAQLGVLSGEYYTGLNEDTRLTYSKLGNGAPEVALERGDVRVVNAGRGEGPRIVTPGVVAAAAGRDTSAYAIEEKAWVVSMVCALEGQVQVAGTGGAVGQTLLVEEGGCVASKPAEGLYLAGTAGKPLPIMAPMSPGGAADTLASAAATGGAGAGGPGAGAASGAGGGGAGAASPAASGAEGAGAGSTPVAGLARDRFPGPDPDVAGAGLPMVRPGIPSNDNSRRILHPCDSPSSGCATSLPGPAVVPAPNNDWVGGSQPPS